MPTSGRKTGVLTMLWGLLTITYMPHATLKVIATYLSHHGSCTSAIGQ